MFCISRMANNTKQKVLDKWKELPAEEKKLIDLYMQMSPENIAQRVEQFGEKIFTAGNDKHKQEYAKQVELYSIAFFLKYHKIPVKGGKRKTRRARKQKGKGTRQQRGTTKV